MRVPSTSEIVLLARVLSRITPRERMAFAASILAQADAADGFRRNCGRAHPLYGDGSLLARCSLLSPPSEPLAGDRDFLICLSLAAHAVRLHLGS